MYLTKGPQELQMQLCHGWPLDVDKVINGTWKYEQQQLQQQAAQQQAAQQQAA